MIWWDPGLNQPGTCWGSNPRNLETSQTYPPAKLRDGLEPATPEKLVLSTPTSPHPPQTAEGLKRPVPAQHIKNPDVFSLPHGTPAGSGPAAGRAATGGLAGEAITLR